MVTPRTGVSIAVLRGEDVLLVRRAREPFSGFWSLPGGSQDAGELLEQAARRELHEETSLEARQLDFVEFFEPILRDGSGRVTAHFVLAIFACRSFVGAARAGDDAAEIRWCAIDALHQLQMTPGTPQIIERIFRRFDTGS